MNRPQITTLGLTVGNIYKLARGLYGTVERVEVGRRESIDGGGSTVNTSVWPADAELDDMEDLASALVAFRNHLLHRQEQYFGLDIYVYGTISKGMGAELKGNLYVRWDAAKQQSIYTADDFKRNWKEVTR